MRPSDRQRERTIAALHRGCADGRLSPSTLEQRVERALGTRDADELRQLTVDVEAVSPLRRLLSRPAGSPAERRAGDPSVWLEGIGRRPLLVGRSPECDVVVGDGTVSRRHAEIVRRDEGFFLSDLSSTNGTWLGGRRIGEVEVAPGDVVELGTVPLRLV